MTVVHLRYNWLVGLVAAVANRPWPERTPTRYSWHAKVSRLNE